MIRRKALAATLLLALLAGCAVQVPPIEGTVWQVYNENNAPKGDWDRLGASRLLIQWTAVDGIAFREGTGMPSGNIPDWKRIAGEPWAREVILGLAGRFDEKGARTDIAQLADASAMLAALPTPLNVVGYYFPVEIDPTWTFLTLARIIRCCSRVARNGQWSLDSPIRR